MIGDTSGTYNIVVSTDEYTVVSQYVPEERKSSSYQSEADLEEAFIKQLQEQGYEYLRIHSADDLIFNLRRQLEKLNHYHFSEDEWMRFFSQKIANPNSKIEDKSRIIQEDNVQVLIRDDKSSKNITIIDKKNIHNNFLQVINQYVEEKGNFENRYDVTILVNGFPLVHCELKRRGVALKEAFNQVNRYQRDSFWADTGLYEYVQVFVISNGTHTKYYSNTTRFSAIQEQKSGKRYGKKTSNSFEFTSFWADASNKVIPDLVDFTRTFFARHTLLNLLTKYCVFTSEQALLVMRPYQIVATERIINRIQIASNHKFTGRVEGGGYIWHTTGSGKTLTSFKTALLASRLLDIDKVLFVVDRKDLDYQTMKEYDRFEHGAANGNKSTAVLQRQLENLDSKGNPHEYKIIVTTIQKLDTFIKKNPTHPIYNKHVVLIFDECHRSQFGEMHKSVTTHFKQYHLFGFTGTPIFAVNAKRGGNPYLRTTEQTFGDRLHTYTIVDAIRDGNVLPFHIDYINTIKHRGETKDKQVEAIDREKALLAPERISEVVRYVLEHFDQKTKRNSGFEQKELANLHGFNSLFAVSSISAAKLYYTEFQKQMKEPPFFPLRIATIYSCGANEAENEDNGFIEDENSDDTSGLNHDDRMFLENAITDYNQMFNTAYDTSSDKFQNYYKDVSLRMKNRDIDLLIVVNMFLTGFDATTLNTLWVDKNLRMHGLLQAFSRTNRILNSIKTFGNIVCFRNLQDATDAAIALFGDKDAHSIVLLKTYNEYYYGYKDENGKYQRGYKERIAELLQKYPIGCTILGETAEKEFIAAFGGILRLQNILSSFDEFEGNEILSERDIQDYRGMYLDLYDKYRKTVDKEMINDDIIFEVELVKQVEVNIDYILMLIAKFHQSNCEDKEVLLSIDKAINSSFELRSKKELIDNFIATINTTSEVQRDWPRFVKQEWEKDLDKVIVDEKLNAKETKEFVIKAFRMGQLKTIGTGISKIMPPISRFGKSDRSQKKRIIIERLESFFNKYFGLEPPDLEK